MISSKVSRRYAKALFSLGREDGRYEQYGRELQEFGEFCLKQQEFFRVISNRIFPTEDRRKILEAVLSKGTFSETVQNFLRLLLERNRMGHIQGICETYARLMDEASNVTRAEVASAKPMKEESLEKLRKALESFTAKQVKLSLREEPSLIGGLVVKIGDMVLDGSVKAQLEGLKASLTH